MSSPLKEPTSKPTNFIKAIVERDLAEGTTNGRVVTRFPPEPNGYLHIGHAKSLGLNFGIASEYNGTCNLRFDDTNPDTEDIEFVESIQNDIRWLGYDWADNLYFASDYFGQLYDYAEGLIKDGLAYVDSSTEEEIRLMRGSVTEPGTPSVYRERSVEENLKLFREMRAGVHPDGAHVLRAKIDLTSDNMKMRDPLMYRIRHAHHYRTGDTWCIYPFYDWAHPLSDAIEGVTHSLCTLEFENNREVYDWFVEHTRQPPRPHQYEFARLGLDYTVMSKRRFIQLVEGNHVSGWDDPRMPTIAGMRRRGYTPASIRNFTEGVGVARANSKSEVGALEFAVRDNLNPIAPRVMCVVNPLKVVITNYPETAESIDAPYFPHDIGKEGSRPVPFSRELYIERDDFMENPPKRFHRLSPGEEVRLRYAYVIRCTDVLKNEAGEVVELRCEYDPETRSGGSPTNRKVKGTIHWVAAPTAVTAELRLYDRLFNVPDPGEGDVNFIDQINPDSARIVTDAVIEPSVLNDPSDTRYQFERQGYFWRDPADSKPDALVFNRIVTLKDSWARIAGNTDEAGQKSEPKAKPVQAQQPANPVLEPLTPVAESLINTYGLVESQARSLADDDQLRSLFERAAASAINPHSLANWVINEVPPVSKAAEIDPATIDASMLASLTDLVDEGTITSLTAKELLPEVLNGASPATLVSDRGLAAVSDADTLTAIVETVVKDNASKVAAYQSGKKGLIGFFIGQVMQQTGGRADPAALRAAIIDAIGE